MQTKQDKTLYQFIIFIQQAPSECLQCVWYTVHPHYQSWRYMVVIRSLLAELTVGLGVGKEVTDDSTLLRDMIEEKSYGRTEEQVLKLSQKSKKASRGG